MDQRPICVFDSGMGGLTCVRQLIRLLPNEELRYFGDTGRVPYGSRSAETITKYARQDLAFLRTFGPKAVVIACGTVTTTALDTLRAENDLPILGVVEPAAKKAAEISKNGRIGIVGTRATIRTGAYERAIRALRPDAVIESNACPLLVPLVEDGRVTEKDEITRMMIKEYFAPMKRANVDTIVLGCTHYPFLLPTLQKVASQLAPDREITFIDPAPAAAQQLVRVMSARGISLIDPGFIPVASPEDSTHPNFFPVAVPEDSTHPNIELHASDSPESLQRIFALIS